MQYNIGAFLFPFKPVWNVFCMWNYVLIPFACHRKAVQYQSWPPSAAQTQPSPWSCSALWVKRSPTGTSLFPRWVSARPLLWYTWVLKETLLHRWHRSAHGLFITCTSSITWCLYVTYSTHIKGVHNKNVVTLACIHKDCMSPEAQAILPRVCLQTGNVSFHLYFVLCTSLEWPLKQVLHYVLESR